MEYAVEVSDLTRTFGSFVAVDHISFRVPRGEIFGFLGANGAGKTTTIRMLCGLLEPSSGSGRVAGFDIMKEYEKIKFQIGYMSQKFSLYDDLTVDENLEFYGGIYGLSSSAIRERKEVLCNELELTQHRSQLCRSMPLGWKQKTALAAALVHDPQMVFLDEPTSGVDPAARRQFWLLIYRLAERGKTIFVTTHFMDEAEYCHRASIMKSGRIVELDNPSELKRKYAAESMQDVFLRAVSGGDA